MNLSLLSNSGGGDKWHIADAAAVPKSIYNTDVCICVSISLFTLAGFFDFVVCLFEIETLFQYLVYGHWLPRRMMIALFDYSYYVHFAIIPQHHHHCSKYKMCSQKSSTTLTYPNDPFFCRELCLSEWSQQNTPL